MRVLSWPPRAVILLVVLCVFGALTSVARVSDWGNRLSDVDSYSEANALREVRNFQEQGLTRYFGLGKALYPGMYPDEGFARDPLEASYYLSPEGVYTHYPPGPEYLLYAATKLFGSEPVWRLRLLPIAIGWSAALFLLLATRRRFGDAVAGMIAAACVFAPTVTDGFVGLHDQGYAAALLMLEIAFAFGAKPGLTPFALLGFLQGWLSFDYVFIVALTPLTIELILPCFDPDHQPRWRLAASRVILVGAGLTAAYTLHFLQVWAYWGSLQGALDDFANAAAHRAGIGIIRGPLGYAAQALSNLKLYFLGLHPFDPWLTLPPYEDAVDWASFRFMGLTLGPWWLLVTIALMLAEWFRPNLAALRARWHAVCLSGFVPTALWSIVMVDHAAIHRHFLYRHQFLMFFVMALFGATVARRAWLEADLPKRLLQRWQAVSLSGRYRGT